MIPDLIAWWLTGRRGAETTNASTTGLLGVRSRLWDDALIERVDLPRSIFPELIEAGTEIGQVRRSVALEIGASAHLTVTAVGSHDTASAIVAVPATREDFAYISCGTWSLVGVELDGPQVSEAGRRAGFTNEGGVDGRVRYLHNVMGLWLLSESVRTWEGGGEPVDLPALLREASTVSGVVFDPDDPRFLPPGDIPARIAALCLEHGIALPNSRAGLVRSILDSLAHAYARALRKAVELTGKTVSVHRTAGARRSRGGDLNWQHPHSGSSTAAGHGKPRITARPGVHRLPARALPTSPRNGPAVPDRQAVTIGVAAPSSASERRVRTSTVRTPRSASPG